MRIAKVIGAVTLSRLHPSLSGGSFKLAIPLSLAELSDSRELAGDAIVVYDVLGAGQGGRIAVGEGAEAAQPFYPDRKPVDAYNAAILDRIDVAT